VSLAISGSSLNKRIGFIESLLAQLKIWRLLLRHCASIGFCFAKIAWLRVRVKLALAAITIVGDTLMRGVSTRKNQTKADAPISHQSNSEVNYLEYHPPPSVCGARSGSNRV
jgi:hypothetical protein